MKSIQSKWYKARRLLPEFVKACADRTLAWRLNNPERYLWQCARQRAKEAKLEFSITPEDIKIPFECPVLKKPFVYNTPYGASVDRVDPNRGYSRDNIQVISRKANLMKQNASVDELKEFANWVNQYIL